MKKFIDVTIIVVSLISLFFANQWMIALFVSAIGIAAVEHPWYQDEPMIYVLYILFELLVFASALVAFSRVKKLITSILVYTPLIFNFWLVGNILPLIREPFTYDHVEFLSLILVIPVVAIISAHYISRKSSASFEKLALAFIVVAWSVVISYSVYFALFPNSSETNLPSVR
jgi:hypothetical protein